MTLYRKAPSDAVPTGEGERFTSDWKAEDLLSLFFPRAGEAPGTPEGQHQNATPLGWQFNPKGGLPRKCASFFYRTQFGGCR